MSNHYEWPSEFRIIDATRNILEGDVLFPFAYEEVECRRIGKGALPLIHLWRHRRAFVLGLRDWKLPYALEAMDSLKQQDYAVAVRHSGGAAVPLDEGVINVSLILPKPQGTIDFRNDFNMMVEILRKSLSRFTQGIHTGEVQGSYCPGDYDLSIHGKKFCGIAQRRQTQASIVQAFVVVDGSGEKRARLAYDFYQAACGEPRQVESSTDSQWLYPIVKTSSMASLSELLQLSSTDFFVTCVKEAISEANAQITYTNDYDPDLISETELMISELRNRYMK